MLPASNRGVGMNIGFPDVCNTIVGPATVPIPYPNIAMNAQAAPFSPTVKVSMMPALHMGSMIPMTMGDEGGTAHPTIKGPSRYTMGSPLVFIDGQPGINLLCPTTGNNANNALGAVLVPSAVTVLYCDAGRPPPEEVSTHELEGDVGWITLRALPPVAPAHFHRAAADLANRGARALVLDLRGNGGGELEAAVRVAEELLDEGDPIAVTVDGDGDACVIRARHRREVSLPLVVVVDGSTASAAEVLAAALQAHGRALVVGSRTYGKGVATAAEPGEGGLVLSSVAQLELRGPHGDAIHGVGVSPDLAVESGVEAAARAAARERSRG